MGKNEKNKMATNPKTLLDLQYEEHVLRTNSFSVEGKAATYFNDIFEDTMDVKCNKIFEEQDGNRLYTVYECYTDSGSNDYLYIIKH